MMRELDQMSVQRDGHTGARMRLPPVLVSLGFLKIGKPVVFFQTAKSRFALSQVKSVHVDGALLKGVAANIRRSGNFVGCYLPKIIRQMFGMFPGARYAVSLDEANQIMIDVRIPVWENARRNDGRRTESARVEG